ncbi:exosortase F system-associated membrane protein [Seonamhaeicola maritimus]|uniref:exosortase F system-associated membrane protein n=1 Tax=Seonamhaeicola maritimus TaxID=2591822 RepID=UPI0024942463|nr:exosortase F system-associated protein [Seonamhaeicola maritimus]
MGKFVKYIVLFLLFGLLILVRYFEDILFYDPYLVFFKNDYLYIDSPRREVAKLVLFTTLRFGLNTIISLSILYALFKSKSIIKFSVFIYLGSYILLMMVYMYFVVNPRQEDYYMFFNVRRFLIQPIILLLLMPAFYYHKLKK